MVRGPDDLPTAVKPNPIPLPVTTDPPSDAQPPLVVQGTVPWVKTRDGWFGFGPYGRKIPPAALPDDRLNLPIIIGTADRDGDLTDGERAHCDVQEGYVDTFTASTLDEEIVTVTIKVDVWNWDLDAIRIADAFVLELTATDHERFQFDNSDEEHAPILLLHGDQLRWKVEGADADVQLNCCLSGWRNWKEFPLFIGPKWIPELD